MKTLPFAMCSVLFGFVIGLPAAWADEVMSAEDILKGLNNKFVVVERPTQEDPATAQSKPDAPPAATVQTEAPSQKTLEGLAQLDLTVQFARNSDAIDTASFPLLMNLGQAIADPRMGTQRVLIAGHTDARGTEEHNLVLSQRRAAAVKQFLSAVKPEISGRLEAVGFGESRLKNQTDPEAAENRRVQIVNLGQ